MTAHHSDLIAAARATASDLPRRGALAKFAQDRHKRAARMAMFALVADDPVIWNQTAAILSHRLTERETASLAFAALRALDPEARAMTCDAATHDDGPRHSEPSGWNLEAIAEYRAARDRRPVRP